MLTDPTPETPFLRSDCDGSCDPSGLRAPHHHHHHHRPGPSHTELLNFARTETPPKRRSARIRRPSLTDEQMARLRNKVDPNNPTRTDYTYSYSSTYRAKPPTPQWDNPKMSRPQLHGGPVEFHESPEPAAPSFWHVFYRPFGLVTWCYRKLVVRQETTTTTVIDTETVDATVPNGHILNNSYDSMDSSADDLSIEYVNPSNRNRLFGALFWLFSSLCNVLLCPFTSVYRVFVGSNRSKGGCCCGWPLLCCNAILLLLAVLLVYAAGPSQTEHILNQYVLPLPVGIWNKSRDVLNLTRISNFYSYSTSGNSQNFVAAGIGADSKERLERLERAFGDLNRRMGEMERTDMTAFAKEADLNAMKSSDSGSRAELRAQLRQLETALTQVRDSSSQLTNDHTTRIDNDISRLEGRLEAMLQSEPKLSSSVTDSLGQIPSLAARLESLEQQISAVAAAASAQNAQKSDAAQFSVQLQTMQNSWQSELAAIRQGLKAEQEELNIKLTQMEQRSANIRLPTSGDLDLATVDERIAIALNTYDADKLGLPDYALEPSGGSVVSTRCSETYSPRTRTESIFGIPLWYSSYSPRAVIQRKSQGTIPGECWAFKGSHGFVVIKLSGQIQVSSVTYEHIHQSLSPDGHIDSAPHRFEVWGLKEEKDLQGVLLGSYKFDDKGPPLQNFEITNKEAPPVQFVEFKILSNHGHPVYTCLYRLRVHGRRLFPAYGTEKLQ